MGSERWKAMSLEDQYLEAKLKKEKRRDCDLIEGMARSVAGRLGYSEIVEHTEDRSDPCYNDYYKTRVWEISSEDIGPVKIKYKGQLVFSRDDFGGYHRHGDWEEQLWRLYSRARNQQE